MDSKELQAFLTGLPKHAQRLRRYQAARFFDVAVEVQHLATDLAPTRTGRLVASIGEYGVRDDELGTHAKRGTSVKLSVGATRPYADWLHDGWRNGDPWFLGIGTQPKTAKKKAMRQSGGRRLTRPFRTVAADGSGGTEIRYGYRLGGSLAKALKGGKDYVGMEYLRRAFDARIGQLMDWPRLKEESNEVIIESIKDARKAARTGGRK